MAVDKKDENEGEDGSGAVHCDVGGFTPTVCNSEAASQAVRDYVAEMEAAAAVLGLKNNFGKRVQPKTRPVSWKPAPLATKLTERFTHGITAPIVKARTSAIARCELGEAPTHLLELEKLRTDQPAPTTTAPLVWPTKPTAVISAPVVKRTLPQELGNRSTPTNPMHPVAGADERKRQPGSKRAQRKAKTKPTTATVEGSTAPAAPAATVDNVWVRAKEVLLKEHNAKTSAVVYADEIQYAEHYEVARRATYRTMPDGYQRAMSPVEKEALFLWRVKLLHLSEAPTFLTETHSLRERDFYRQTQREHMCFKLYVATPPQLKWGAETAKFHFCSQLVGQNQKDRDADVIELLDDVHLFTCSAESRLAVLRFVRPELRDKWINKTFKLPFGLITLRATDTFEQENKKAGLDAPAIELLYPIHLLGKPDLPFNDVHAIADALSGGLPILDIIPLEATGARALDTHEWKIVLNSMDPPPGMDKLRFLTIQQGERKFTMGVHQPRLAARHPCSVCLGIGHFRNQCKHKGNAAKLAEIRPQFERVLTIPATSEYVLEPAAETLEEHMMQMDRVRHALAPELAALEAAAKAKHDEEVAAAAAKAAAAAAELAAAADAAIAEAIAAAKLEAETAAQKAKQERKRKKKIKGHQAKKNQSPAMKLAAVLSSKLRGTSPKASKVSKASSTTSSTTKDVATRPRVAATPKEERWSHVTGDYHHVGGKTPGAKRLWSERELSTQPPAAAFAGKTGDVTMAEPAVEEEHEHPPARVTKLIADVNGVRVAVRGQPVEGRHGPQQSTVTKYFQREATVNSSESTANEEVSIVKIKPASTPMATLCAVMNGVGMLIVSTPGNGSCLFHAITAAQSRRCGLTINAKNPTEIAVTMQLRVSLYAQLRQLFGELLSTGSLDLRTMASTYLTDVPEDATDEQKTALLLKHFLAAEQQPTLQVPRAFWGGEVEIAVFVYWAEEPMYVMDAVRDGVLGIQRYVKIDIVLDDGSTASKVVQEMISVETFTAHIEVYKRQRVIPLVLICNHAWNAGTNCSHFTAARLPNSVYKAWVGTDDLIVEMKRRLNRVVAIIENLEETGIDEQPLRLPTPPDSSSEYEPSGTVTVTGTEDSGPTEPHERASDRSASCRVDLAQHMPSFELLPEASWESFRASIEPLTHPEQGDEDMEGSGALLSPMEAASQHHLSSILSTPPDPGLSYDAIERLMPISPAPSAVVFNDNSEAQLLTEFKNVKIASPEALVTLNKINEANAVALRHWMNKQVKSYPKTYELVRRETTAVAVCDAAKDHPDVIRSLLRSIPFPEIVIA